MRRSPSRNLLRQPRAGVAGALAGFLVIASCTSSNSSGDETSTGPGSPTTDSADIHSSTTSSESDAPLVDDPTATTVVLNAVVYTVDDDNPIAEAFAYDADGIIIAVGSEDEVLAAAGDDPQVIDANGNMVLPGFGDPHVHVPEAGINEGLCYFEPGQSLEVYEELAAECAAEQADSTWVRAAGPSLFELRDTDELPIDVLDRAIPDRPALVLDDLGHAVLTNSLGLEAAGIDPDDPDPQGGVFHRDAASGRLTGLLLEDAQQLVRNAARPDLDTSYQGLLVALDELAKNGVTSVSDAGGYWQQGHSDAWQRAADEGTLTVRASNALYLYPDLDVDAQLAEFERRFSDDPDSLLRLDTAKIYIDGILDLGTALLVEPYDEPVDPNYPNGFAYFTDEQLETYVPALYDIGYRMNFHVIGDAATRKALDVIEAIDDDPEAIAERRNRTTHTYLVHPDDVARFAEIGMVADFQIGPESSATDYHEFLSDFIGDRAFDLIPVAELLEADADVTFSSDWDADPLSPFGTIERSLTRDENALDDVEEAIYLTTMGPAYAMGLDQRTGSIEVAKLADFVIIDQNLLDIDVTRIDETVVLLTAVGGREVHRADDFFG